MVGAPPHSRDAPFRSPFSPITSARGKSPGHSTSSRPQHREEERLSRFPIEAGKAQIPQHLDDGSPMVFIEDAAFFKCERLLSVALPSSVKTIGKQVFAGCSSLRSIQLSSELKAIGQGAFKNCAALGEIKLPPGLITIGPGAFMFCTALKDIVLPVSVEYLDADTFRGCSALTAVDIPPRLVALRDGAFAKCVSLSQITLPDGLRHIGNNCFDGCTHLGNSITKLPSALQILGQSAFSNIPKINALALPEDLETHTIRMLRPVQMPTKDVADLMMRKQKGASKQGATVARRRTSVRSATAPGTTPGKKSPAERSDAPQTGSASPTKGNIGTSNSSRGGLSASASERRASIGSSSGIAQTQSMSAIAPRSRPSLSSPASVTPTSPAGSPKRGRPRSPTGGLGLLKPPAEPYAELRKQLREMGKSHLTQQTNYGLPHAYRGMFP